MAHMRAGRRGIATLKPIAYGYCAWEKGPSLRSSLSSALCRQIGSERKGPQPQRGALTEFGGVNLGTALDKVRSRGSWP